MTMHYTIMLIIVKLEEGIFDIFDYNIQKN